MTRDPSDTCWTVLRAAAEGDPAARSSFSRSHSVTIRQYLEARWRGRALSAEIDDAQQEVFVECFKPGGVLERADPARGDFRGLLFGVVRNVARRIEERALKHGRANVSDSAWLARITSGSAGPPTQYDRNWARSLIRQCKRMHRDLARQDGQAGLRRLEILERRFQGNETIRDLAAEWGVPSQEAHNLYRKARTEFHRCLREVVARHCPAGADLDAECRKVLGLLS